MDWFGTLNEVINLRSFSNLWYWIVLAVMWSTASFWIMGVPYDIVQRAGAQGGQAEVDLHDIVRVNANRLTYIADVSGIWIVAFGTFFLTFLGLSGFVYGFQLAQAIFLLSFPMAIVGFLTLRLARRVLAKGLRGAALRKALTLHRVLVQVIGMLSIFVTALWGMYQNLSHMMPNQSL
ncbi:MAG: component of SufBCD complex [Rhodobacterales bacterium]|nr:component of SufBCD complex [Rhodobacterales bacterium]MDX5412689.1 component of SufBCD complex [Rhodobacterales bacterium]